MGARPSAAGMRQMSLQGGIYGGSWAHAPHADLLLRWLDFRGNQKMIWLDSRHEDAPAARLHALALSIP